MLSKTKNQGSQSEPDSQSLEYISQILQNNGAEFGYQIKKILILQNELHEGP